MRRAVILVLSLLFAGLYATPEINLDHIAHPKRKSRSSTTVDHATYLQLISLGQIIAVQNGYSLTILGAQIPGGDRDTSYNGIVKIRAIEQNPNNSVVIYQLHEMGFFPDTMVQMRGGSAMILVQNTESEYTILQAYTETGELRPSFPVGVFFEPQGSRATSLVIRGSKKLHTSEDGFGVNYVAAVDDSGRIDPTYQVFTPIMPIASGVVSVGVTRESVPNSSASISPFFGSGSGPVVDVPLLGGIGMFFVSNTEEENVVIQAISTASPPLESSPEFSLDFVPPSVGTDIMLFSFTGFATNVGYDKGIMAMAFTRDGPDITNNTTEVLLSLVDITGLTPSYSLEPRGWVNFINGVRGFTFNDAEPDSFGLISVIDTRGEPTLNKISLAPALTVYPVGRAVRAHLLPQISACVNDTLKVSVLAMDEFGNIDTTYYGYIQLDITDPNSPSVRVFDFNSGMAPVQISSVIRMLNGRAIAYIVDSEPETLSIKASDAEKTMFYDLGYLGGEESVSAYILPQAGTPAIEYRLVMPSRDALFNNELYIVTLIAVDRAGNIDRSYNGSATLTPLLGTPTFSPSILNFNRGVTTFTIFDDEAEDVILRLSGELGEQNLNFTFYDQSAGGAIFSDLSEKSVLVNAENPAVIAIINRSGINAAYSGNITIAVDDPNVNGSVRCPSFVRVTNGVGSFTIMDSEPEEFVVRFSGDSGIAGARVDVRACLQLTANLPAYGSVNNGNDTLRFRAVDGLGALFPYSPLSSPIHIEIQEQNPNGSATVSTNDPVMFNGVAYALIEDSEPETVRVYANIIDRFLLPTFEIYTSEYGYLVGTIVFRYVGVDESKPVSFRLYDPYPNPFNSALLFPVSLDKPGEVSIEIYNILGEKVRTVFNGTLERGEHSFIWNGRSDSGAVVSSGVYLYRVVSAGVCKAGSVVLMK